MNDLPAEPVTPRVSPPPAATAWPAKRAPTCFSTPTTPWTGTLGGPEAFEKARKEDKPIFLSIGYSTCHWCHVMEVESFEDPEVARLMNETFVSIKVDREERPDIDKIYMAVCQMMTGRGGWPLTIIMTPDKKPFFAATYIPKRSRWGRMGMLDLIPRIKELWTTRRQEILRSADQVAAALQQFSQNQPGHDLGASTLARAQQQLRQRFDETYGGFGDAPKFPTPHNLLFLLRHWKRTGDTRSLAMVERTLQAMRLGGIYDHVGFGFHRYSTDRAWLVPHFEKMLYDQALLAMAYTEAYQATHKKEYEQTAREIFTYVLRDMTDPAGGFYSAEDADSEGEEGKFYLWTFDEIRDVLGKEDAELFTNVFHITRAGNFTDPVSGTRPGTNILHLDKPLEAIAAELGMSEDDLRKRLETARVRLFAVRKKRIHPGKDDKILTDWNGLMIAALAKAARAFDEPRYTKAARRAADFILQSLRRPDGRLLHRYRDSQADIPAHLDDYAFFIWGLLELYEADFDVKHLKTALRLNEDAIKHFWDEADGGFYFTADDAEELLVRQKEIYDGAVPSGNSAAMLNLLRLSRMTMNTDLEEKAASIARAFSGTVKRFPAGHTQLLLGVDFGLGPSYEIVIAGQAASEDTIAMLRALRSQFLPNKVVLLRPAEQDAPQIAHLAEFTKDQRALDGKATAYVCRNYNCELPTTDASQMLQLLRQAPPQ